MGSRKSIISNPVARDDGLLIEAVGDETVIYDIESKEAHCLKALAAVVFAHADGQTSAADIAELAGYRLGQSFSEADVADAISQLETRALLDTPLRVTQGVSRREAVRRFATAGVAAAAVPTLITTILAPNALAAGAFNSQVATGDCCGDSAKSACEGLNPICSSGHCCQNNGGKQCNQCKCVGDKNDCEVKSACASQADCPAGQECVNGSCCTVIVAPGGGNTVC